MTDNQPAAPFGRLTGEQRRRAEDNIGLVYAYLTQVKERWGLGPQELDDLRPYVEDALCRAAETYRADLGHKFSTYAYAWMRCGWLRYSSWRKREQRLRRQSKLLADDPVWAALYPRCVWPDHDGYTWSGDVCGWFAAAGLSDRSRMVLTLRYRYCLTQQRVGGLLGYTRQRINQIEASALRRLRNLDENIFSL